MRELVTKLRQFASELESSLEESLVPQQAITIGEAAARLRAVLGEHRYFSVIPGAFDFHGGQPPHTSPWNIYIAPPGNETRGVFYEGPTLKLALAAAMDAIHPQPMESAAELVGAGTSPGF